MVHITKGVLALVAGGVLGLAAVNAPAAVLVGYNFGTVGDGTLLPTLEAAGASGSAIVANTGGPYLTDAAVLGNTTEPGVIHTNFTVNNTAPAAGALPILSRPNGHNNGNSATAIAGYVANIATNQNYHSFTLSADSAALPLILNGISLDFGPGGGSDRGFVLAYSTSTDWSNPVHLGTVVATGGFHNNTTFQHYTFPMAEVGVTDVEFRFITFANSTSGRAMFFDNIQVEGVVVPEPATMGVLALGGMLLLARRRQ